MALPTTNFSIVKPEGSDVADETAHIANAYDIIDRLLTQFGFEGTVIASAATLNLPTTGSTFHITGTTTVTAISTRVTGNIVCLTFDGALVLTHNATSLILRSGANYTTVAGDTLWFKSEGAGNWREVAHAMTFDSTTPAAQASGDLGTVGTAVAAARRDHVHPLRLSQGRDLTPATVSTTNAETTVATITIPGGTLSTDRQLRVVAWGSYVNGVAAGAASDYTVRVKYGGVLVGIGTFPALANDSLSRVWRAECLIAPTNSATAQTSFCDTRISDGTANAVAAPPTSGAGNFAFVRGSANTSVGVNSAVNQDVVVTLQHSVSAAATTATAASVTVEVL
jgi:hypothetical protein